MMIDESEQNAARVEEKLQLVDGGASIRDVLREQTLRGKVLAIGLLLGGAALFGWLALNSSTTGGRVVALAVTALYGYAVLMSGDRVVCLVSERWTCRDCQHELARWSADADDAVDVDVEDTRELEGAH